MEYFRERVGSTRCFFLFLQYLYIDPSKYQYIYIYILTSNKITLYLGVRANLTSYHPVFCVGCFCFFYFPCSRPQTYPERYSCYSFFFDVHTDRIEALELPKLICCRRYRANGRAGSTAFTLALQHAQLN